MNKTGHRTIQNCDKISSSIEVFSGIKIIFKIMKTLKYIALTVVFWSLFMPFMSYGLTIEEALSLARQNLPFYKASELKVRASEYLYDASFSPYLPSLDITASEVSHYTPSDEYRVRAYDINLSYIIFDGGKRRANRDIAGLNLDNDKEDLRKVLLDLDLSVKTAFYTAAAQAEILKQREIQLKDAQKDYEVAEGRYKFGVARFSDVLQASVRLEQARFNLLQAEGDLRKAMAELNSLIGKPLDTIHEVRAILDVSPSLPDRERLSLLVLNRPEIKQAENSILAAEKSKALVKSTFYPSVALSVAHTNTEIFDRREIFTTPTNEENMIKLTATWNLFELGKFFKHKASGIDELIYAERLSETKRLLLLDLHNAYEDLVTSLGKTRVAEERLRQSEHNYQQAFNEYKVGKGDILSLVQAESLLADAREQVIITKLNVVLTRARLERVAGIDSLEAF